MKENKFFFSKIPQFTKYGSYSIDISWSYLENQLEHYSKDYELELDPDFQRAHVWNEEKRSKYVEYILRGGHSSREIYFNCPIWNKINVKRKEYKTLVLVDGKQRLESVRMFLRNELEIFADGLLGNSHPLKYFDFADKPHMLRASFKFNVNDLATRKEVLQWYLEMNSGGVVHTKEELEKVQELLKLENRGKI